MEATLNRHVRPARWSARYAQLGTTEVRRTATRVGQAGDVLAVLAFVMAIVADVFGVYPAVLFWVALATGGAAELCWRERYARTAWADGYDARGRRQP